MFSELRDIATPPPPLVHAMRDVRLRWVPSHLAVPGNEAADALAERGRELHPNNLLPLSKRRRVAEWDELGLEPMVETEPLSDPDTANIFVVCAPWVVISCLG